MAGRTDSNIGYVYRRLPDNVPTGIFECNPRCKCKSTCLNRVAQVSKFIRYALLTSEIQSYEMSAELFKLIAT